MSLSTVLVASAISALVETPITTYDIHCSASSEALRSLDLVAFHKSSLVAPTGQLTVHPTVLPIVQPTQQLMQPQLSSHKLQLQHLFQITIQTLTGKMTKYDVTVCDTTNGLKQKIVVEEGIPYDQQRLL